MNGSEVINSIDFVDPQPFLSFSAAIRFTFE